MVHTLPFRSSVKPSKDEKTHLQRKMLVQFSQKPCVSSSTEMHVV